MGELVVQQFVSADGFAADDNNRFTLFDDVEGDSSDFDQCNLRWMEGLGAIVLGAETYRMFSSYWPTPQADGELVGPTLNALPKYVFSRTLTSAPWGDHPAAAVVADDVGETVRRLKTEIAGDLVLWGSLSLGQSLFRAGAVDIVRLVVLPVAIGSGRTVFPAGQPPTRLHLVGSRTFAAGLVASDYTVVRESEGKTSMSGPAGGGARLGDRPERDLLVGDATAWPAGQCTSPPLPERASSPSSGCCHEARMNAWGDPVSSCMQVLTRQRHRTSLHQQTRSTPFGTATECEHVQEGRRASVRRAPRPYRSGHAPWQAESTQRDRVSLRSVGSPMCVPAGATNRWCRESAMPLLGS